LISPESSTKDIFSTEMPVINRNSFDSTNPTPSQVINATKFGFVVNPLANGGKCGQIFKDEIINILSKQKEKSIQIIYTKCQGDGVRVAQKLLDMGNEIIISVGGDGTLYEVLNGVMNHDFKNKCIIGSIPLGN
jgi:diacylglycerol kinase family enzyme